MAAALELDLRSAFCHEQSHNQQKTQRRYKYSTVYKSTEVQGFVQFDVYRVCREENWSPLAQFIPAMEDV